MSEETQARIRGVQNLASSFPQIPSLSDNELWNYASDILTALTPELNPSVQRCLPRFFTGDFNF
jgi:hypothetical protein